MSIKTNDPLIIAGQEFSSRLLVGTGKYKDFTQAKQAIKASGAEIVTAALRRVDLKNATDKTLPDYISLDDYVYLPNSAGCYNAEDAVRTLRLARQISNSNLIKLEIIGDKKTLYPDMIETLRATEILVSEGFNVMVYCTDDILICQKLEKIGAIAIMPLAAPIGSGLEYKTR